MRYIMDINVALELVEKYLSEQKKAGELAELISAHIHMSTFMFQKTFQLVTGYSFGEYVRNRRLYEAAIELAESDKKVIDVAIKYGYDTTESFTKAFKRFHGITPTMARKRQNPITGFHPIKINVSIEGGAEMKYYFETMEAFSLIGFQKMFSYPSSYEEIPRFYRELGDKFFKGLEMGKGVENEIEQAIVDFQIGDYGAVIYDKKGVDFRYIVGGMYSGGKVPNGLVVEKFPATEWIKFTCKGKNPSALQRLNTQVFRDWLPKHKGIELRCACNIEWQGSEISEIWLPIKKRT